MNTKEAIKKEKLIKCVDCANYPNMCGYYSTDKRDFYRKRTCPYVNETQQGFKPAEEMSLKDTIYQFEMMLKGTDKNTQLLNRAYFYLEQGWKAIEENVELKKEHNILTKYKQVWIEFYYDLLSKDKRDYRVRELRRHLNHKYRPEEELKNLDENLKMVINCLSEIDWKKAFKEPKKEK